MASPLLPCSDADASSHGAQSYATDYKFRVEMMGYAIFIYVDGALVLTEATHLV